MVTRDMLLFIDIFNFNVSADEITLITLLVGIIVFLILGGMKKLFVWGPFYRDLEKQLKNREDQLEKAEKRHKETERRLRMMEIIAMRGTNVAEDAIDVLARIEIRDEHESD